MKIYVDIDGVLLKKDLTIPEYGEEFISFIITNHDCYWLTTHCKGDNNNALNYLSKCYPLSVLEQFKMIRNTNWTDLKTEAIDLNSDFIWLEDYPFESEKIVLNKANKIDSLITVDLNRENELKSVQKKIEMITVKLNNNSTTQRGFRNGQYNIHR
jgi:hypothetical protein